MNHKPSNEEAMAIVEDVLGCKWTVRVIAQIRQGNFRPGKIRRSIKGISVKVLNERLKKLLRYGLVKKKNRFLKTSECRILHHADR